MKDENKDNITATVGLFSGRPNPKITLENDLAAEFSEMIHAAIGKEAANPPPAPKLGSYYGFTVTMPRNKAQELELPQQIRINNGVLTVTRNKEENHWRDVANIEELLIKQAYEEGLGDLLQKFDIPNPK
ncbi:hypothetical protein [Fodinibius halophilus]|uniref:Uncharacterized protein n=1 Tax=Fodinibius halophilus TaxID=1736908 RepID=A0A6M1TIM4_9BACT|nr:hypothetical protein [Fodinibius halophilus]NGP89902.1 hypothetical protein [Fodinibius halophilus]